MWLLFYAQLCILFCNVISQSPSQIPSMEVISGPSAFIQIPADGSLREIRTTNDMDSSIKVHCRDKNNDFGAVVLTPGDCYKFTFDRSFWGVSHFWCLVWYKYDTVTHFPAYNEGAPADNNIFVIRDDGIYMKNFDTLKFEMHRERKN